MEFYNAMNHPQFANPGTHVPDREFRRDHADRGGAAVDSVRGEVPVLIWNGPVKDPGLTVFCFGRRPDQREERRPLFFARAVECFRRSRPSRLRSL